MGVSVWGGTGVGGANLWWWRFANIGGLGGVRANLWGDESGTCFVIGNRQVIRIRRTDETTQ